MITLYQLLIHVIECFHDKYVIQGSDMSKVKESNKWHLWDGILWVFFHGGIAYVFGWQYLITGLIIRFWTLQVVLNYIRGYELKYLGTSKGDMDYYCRVWFGESLTLILKTVLFVGCFLYEIIKVHA